MSLKKHEGYLLIDSRFSPGVTDEMVVNSGLKDVPVVKEGQTFESATVTCSHCQTILIVNRERTRGRAFCRKCNHYVCDACAVIMAHTQMCFTMKERLDQLQENAVLREQRSSNLNLKGV